MTTPTLRQRIGRALRAGTRYVNSLANRIDPPGKPGRKPKSLPPQFVPMYIAQSLPTEAPLFDGGDDAA